MLVFDSSCTQVKELERLLEENKKIVEPLKLEQQALEKELMELRKVEEELTHEKDALHKQCNDQLLQISALQSKLDAHKHGLEEARQISAMDEEEDDEGSVTLLQQLEQEREALERKDKEVDGSCRIISCWVLIPRRGWS